MAGVGLHPSLEGIFNTPMNGIGPSIDLGGGSRITEFDGVELVSDDDLTIELSTALTSYFGTRCAIRQMRRRLATYRSSFPLEELSVTLQGGTEIGLMFKSLGRQFNSAERVKPTFLHHPERELDAYRYVLDAKRLNTPICYGAVVRKQYDRYWLFLERVNGTRLREIGDFGLWLRTATWLADLHQTHAADVETLKRRPHLLACNHEYFVRWISRALQISGRDEEPRAQLLWLARRYDTVVDRLAALPVTFIHGEFYPSNVLICRKALEPAVCAVDWEMAGVGPGLLDLAALVSGWAEEFVIRLARAYYEAGGRAVSGENSFEAFFDALNYCRLHLAVQWLGWCADWSPPIEHKLDWLREARRLMGRLGLH